MTPDSFYQAESYAEELRAGYTEALEAAIESAEIVKYMAPGTDDDAYWRGAKCAVAAIKALR